MNYKLTVEAYEENPNFATELKVFQEESRCNYGQRPEIPVRDIVKKKLEVCVTEEQWLAIQKAVIEQFKS